MKINRETYEEFLLLYTDGELNVEEREAVEKFVSENPDLAEELEMLQQAVLTPDKELVFGDKELLFRKEEEDRKVVPFPWYRIAAAAAVLLLLTSAAWMYVTRTRVSQPGEVVATEKPASTVKPSVTVIGQETRVPDVASSSTDKLTNADGIVRAAPVNRSARKSARGTALRTRRIIDNGIAYTPKTLLDSSALKTELPDETIDTPAAARTAEAEQVVAGEPLQPTIEYVDGDANNSIYFANTSLPKKSKLRGVFRKASRILDKVTSFQ